VGVGVDPSPDPPLSFRTFQEENDAVRLQLPALLVLIGLGLPAAGAAEPTVSRDDFKKYMETQLALKDPRVLKMPENIRIQRIAEVNFKMKGAQLREVLDRVEAAGGPEGLAKKEEAAVRAALEGLPFADRVREVRVDTTSGHVVTYLKWELPADFHHEAVWLALKTAGASELTSTIHLTGLREDGETLWIAKIASDRTRHIREDRIGDWAKTRYLRLFEVDVDNTRKGGGASSSADAAAP